MIILQQWTWRGLLPLLLLSATVLWAYMSKNIQLSSHVSTMRPAYFQKELTVNLGISA